MPGVVPVTESADAARAIRMLLNPLPDVCVSRVPRGTNFRMVYGERGPRPCLSCLVTLAAQGNVTTRLPEGNTPFTSVCT